MNSPTALVAHPFPIVVDALAAMVSAAGFDVARATDMAATARAFATAPDLALVAVALAGEASARGGTRTLLIDNEDADGILGLNSSAERIAAAIAAVAPPATRAPALTPRERDVARLVAAGQRNRVIAGALGISEGTVKMHLHNVYTKLGLQSRTQLAMATRL